MDISLNGMKFIASFEKVVLHTYDDGFGYPTIGIGHLLVPGDGFDRNSRITEAQAYELFRKDLQKYISTVNTAVKVNLSQNQFDALVSLCFNIGREAFRNSSCVRALNQGRYLDAAERLTHWNRAKGKVVRGLVRRREAEKAMFLRSDKPIVSKNTEKESNGVMSPSIPAVQSDEPAFEEQNQSVVPQVPSQPPSETITKSETSFVDSLNVYGEKTQTIATKVQSVSDTVSNVSKSSVGTFIWKQILAFVMLITGLIENNWEWVLVGLVILFVAAWLWNESKKRAAERTVAMIKK